MVTAAKKKGCTDINNWTKSIINHSWWCCATCNKDPTLLREKWVSILYHIRNVHKWEDSTLYLRCEHAKRTKRERFEKLWLTEGSPAHAALVAIVKDKFLLNDLKYLIDFSHTGDLEV